MPDDAGPQDFEYCVDYAGGFFGLTEWEGLPLDEFQGRFVQLLPPKPATPEVVEVARAMLIVKGLNEQKLRGSPRRR